jgi:Family of unknown function (DUF6356)
MEASTSGTTPEKKFLRQEIGRLFIDHPHSLGESYWQHQSHALGFGIEMVRGGLACMIHAVIPGLFAQTASTTIRRLHARMTSLRRFGESRGAAQIPRLVSR